MRALLSVSDKTGLIDFARGLIDRGVQLVSTGGTARALADAGLAVTSVSDVTGFPEMMDGRVKTLHPAVHGGILARRGRPDDLAAIAGQGITPIDLVVVNLYPFAQTASSDAPVDELIEQIDIGGPSMVRAAAKNFEDVLIVVDPGDYRRVLELLDRNAGGNASRNAGLEAGEPAGAPAGEPSGEPAGEPSGARGSEAAARRFRFELARKAFAHTAEYDATIAAALDAVETDGASFERSALTLDGVAPDLLHVRAAKLRDLRYGENPHQAAALYADRDWGFGSAQVLQGKALSFTNLLDLDAAARLALEFDEPAAAVIKHTNPCGVATAGSLRDAYVTAREVDPLSAFGGIVGLNRPLDGATAAAIAETFIECVIAPAVDDEARGVLSKKKNLRLVVADFNGGGDAGQRDVRSIMGAWLVQKRDGVVECAEPWADGVEVVPGEPIRVVTKRAPTADEWEALRFAWRVCAHVKSNTVIFARAGRAVAVGAGQMSRVDAVNVATMKAAAQASADLRGTVAASDAFFPFRDGLDAIAQAGATAIAQPGGSKRDADVIAAADEQNLAMVLTGRRHFRH
ncbi:MAG: bifunctional phosphoribosylaminoimidazolecarboxamide formyltransferase/IMP cyclohydrolase [Acidobacteria bacterium]|nr:bifunctional phosphoribosylaminoimidazolecarboxamide formyltransferase/IMP cyclohydrolase [Acidobacteriota bacterium]MYJ05964.1 bifunctional phosphoribosylaminoimidazolecarboxamide formyltransferase/IMP cyclohydrolase [Acidobacteriota bacterium]